MFHPNHPVCSAFTTVSLRRPSGYWLAENITIGGSKVRFCHWLYGARFSTPSRLTLDSQPIGRGTVQLLKGEKGNGLFSVAGSYFTSGPSPLNAHMDPPCPRRLRAHGAALRSRLTKLRAMSMFGR